MSLRNLVNFSYRFWKLIIFPFLSSQQTQKKLFPIFLIHKRLRKFKMAAINKKLLILVVIEIFSHNNSHSMGVI